MTGRKKTASKEESITLSSQEESVRATQGHVGRVRRLQEKGRLPFPGWADRLGRLGLGRCEWFQWCRGPRGPSHRHLAPGHLNRDTGLMRDRYRRRLQVRLWFA